MFEKLIALITECSKYDFFAATNKLNDFISRSEHFFKLISQIGTIPESIAHDSTEEKLFAKASDAILSRAFRELGLKSTVLSERGDAADVMAQSRIYDYTLVADAKAFRLSRTAKNQKDFKITALSNWRKDNDYAVLCSPYFQYPQSQSQIFAQAIDNNFCLLSWEHLIFLLAHGIKENKSVNLSTLWNFSESFSHNVVVAEKEKCFIRIFDTHLLSTVGQTQTEFDKTLAVCVRNITQRGQTEITYWEDERNTIAAYTREEAVSELIKCKKIDKKSNK